MLVLNLHSFRINTRLRKRGLYYETAWRTAVDLDAKIISITSFNEWHEGTQIEPAIPMKSDDGYEYKSYLPDLPSCYLDITKKWTEKFEKTTK